MQPHIYSNRNRRTCQAFYLLYFLSAFLITLPGIIIMSGKVIKIKYFRIIYDIYTIFNIIMSVIHNNFTDSTDIILRSAR